MRESRWNRRPVSRLAVRPHFPQGTNREAHDFGLKNFGDSPALNLRIKVQLREDDNLLDSLSVSSKSRHFHLEEYQFLSLLTEAAEQSFGDLTDAEDPVYQIMIRNQLSYIIRLNRMMASNFLEIGLTH